MRLYTAKKPSSASSDYMDGKKSARRCYDYIINTGRTCPGTSLYRHVIEAVAYNVERGQPVDDYKFELIRWILLDKFGGDDFHKGVYDFITEKVYEYRHINKRISKRIK